MRARRRIRRDWIVGLEQRKPSYNFELLATFWTEDEAMRFAEDYAAPHPTKRQSRRTWRMLGYKGTVSLIVREATSWVEKL